MAVETEDKRPVKVSGEIRYMDQKLWNRLAGPKPPRSFENNGCSYSPDRILGYAIWPACVLHDWHYSGRVPGMDKKTADKHFRTNLWRALRYQGATWPMAAWITASRYIAVTKFGDLAFNKPDG